MFKNTIILSFILMIANAHTHGQSLERIYNFNAEELLALKKTAQNIRRFSTIVISYTVESLEPDGTWQIIERHQLSYDAINQKLKDVVVSKYNDDNSKLLYNENYWKNGQHVSLIRNMAYNENLDFKGLPYGSGHAIISSSQINLNANIFFYLVQDSILKNDLDAVIKNPIINKNTFLQISEQDKTKYVHIVTGNYEYIIDLNSGTLKNKSTRSRISEGNNKGKPMYFSTTLADSYESFSGWNIPTVIKHIQRKQDGAISFTSRIRLSSNSIKINETIDQANFDVIFPEGCDVTDTIHNQKYRSSSIDNLITGNNADALQSKLDELIRKSKNNE